MQKKKEIKIYWEKQGQEQLCGVNCVNTLLQGPYFNEVQLANIGLEIDQVEQGLLGPQKKNYRSNNVAEDGNFSVQVLAEALKRMQLYFESVDSKINQNQDLSLENGFLCNSSSHWFTIRKIENTWYNLNSTNRGGPEIISDFYLSAFLFSVKESGYTIFVVKGTYPQPENEEHLFENLNPNQKLYTKIQVRAVHEKRIKKKNYKLNIGGSDERDYEEAIKRSLGKQNSQNHNSDDDEEWEKFENPETWEPDPQEKQNLQMFQGQAVKIQDSSSIGVNYEKFHMNSDMDPELGFVIKLSLEGKFQVRSSQGINIQFAMPNGRQIFWTFRDNATIEDLYDFVLFSLPEQDSFKFILSTLYPKINLVDVTLPLAAYGIDDMTQIFVSKL